MEQNMEVEEDKENFEEAVCAVNTVITHTRKRMHVHFLENAESCAPC